MDTNFRGWFCNLLIPSEFKLVGFGLCGHTLNSEKEKKTQLKVVLYNTIFNSALFSRRLNFKVFADFFVPAKIAPLKLT